MSLRHFTRVIQEAAKSSPALVRKPYRGEFGSLTGHCYAASEAMAWVYPGLKPSYLNHETWPEGLAPGETHWFLTCSDSHEGGWYAGQIVDVTAEQFDLPIPYAKGKRCGFLTKEPSKRAMELLRKAGIRK